MFSLAKRFDPILARISALSPGRKLLLYAIIAIVVYGTMIVVDNAFLMSAIDPDLSHPDMDVYRARTQTILDGGLLYRDVHTETPPMINYILVPVSCWAVRTTTGCGAPTSRCSLSCWLLFCTSACAHLDENKAYFAGMLGCCYRRTPS